MTEAPENLRKFLESNDPAMVRMGLSMAKGSGVPDEMIGLVAGLYMWHDDKTIRAAAKSTFVKLAPDELKTIMKETWVTGYRTIKTSETLSPKVKVVFERFKDTSLDNVDVWRPALLSRWEFARPAILNIVKTFGASSIDLIIEALREKEDANSRTNHHSIVETRLRTRWRSTSPLDGAIDTLVELAATQKLIEALNQTRTSAPIADALGKIGDKRAVEPLIKAVKNASNSTAMWALGKIGDKRAVEPLIMTVKNEDYDSSRCAIWALGELGDTRALESLINVLDSSYWGKEGPRPGYDGSELVIRVLGKIGGARVIKPLIKMLEKAHGTPNICAELLGEIGDKRAVEPLMKYMLTGLGKANYWDRDRASAAEALVKIGDPSILNLLVEELGGERGVQSAVVRVLDGLGWKPENKNQRIIYYISGGSIKGKPAIGPLIEALGHENQWVRERATSELGKTGNMKAVKPIIEACKKVSLPEVNRFGEKIEKVELSDIRNRYSVFRAAIKRLHGYDDISMKMTILGKCANGEITAEDALKIIG